MTGYARRKKIDKVGSKTHQQTSARTPPALRPPSARLPPPAFRPPLPTPGGDRADPGGAGRIRAEGKVA